MLKTVQAIYSICLYTIYMLTLDKDILMSFVCFSQREALSHFSTVLLKLQNNMQALGFLIFLAFLTGSFASGSKDGMTKILVTSGYVHNGDGTSRITEVIDLEDPDNDCEEYAPCPDSAPPHAVSSGLIDGSLPFFCGGSDGIFISDTCFFLGDDTVQATMMEPRAFSPSVLVDSDSRLWLIGGQNGVMSTELIAPGQDPIPGPDMPARLEYHCAVKLAHDTVMIIGGVDADDTDRNAKSWIFDPIEEAFVPGPKLTVGKNSLACGVVRDQEAQKDIVIVAGGFDGNYYDTIETWVVGSDEDFQVSGFTPSKFCCAAGERINLFSKTSQTNSMFNLV